jgi:DNA-binding phage protein
VKTKIFNKLKNIGEIMVFVKSTPSNNYHDYLIESLHDPQEVAGYIEVVLEDGKDEPTLLPKVLQNVMESYTKYHQLSAETQDIYEQLISLLQKDNCAEIYTFIALLNALDLQININVK